MPAPPAASRPPRWTLVKGARYEGQLRIGHVVDNLSDLCVLNGGRRQRMHLDRSRRRAVPSCPCRVPRLRWPSQDPASRETVAVDGVRQVTVELGDEDCRAAIDRSPAVLRHLRRGGGAGGGAAYIITGLRTAGGEALERFRRQTGEADVDLGTLHVICGFPELPQGARVVEVLAQRISLHGKSDEEGEDEESEDEEGEDEESEDGMSS